MFLRCLRLRLRLLSRLPLHRFHFFARVLLELFSFATTRAGSKLQDGLEAIHVCECVPQTNFTAVSPTRGGQENLEIFAIYLSGIKLKMNVM